jgi:hypothetical protein
MVDPERDPSAAERRMGEAMALTGGVLGAHLNTAWSERDEALAEIERLRAAIEAARDLNLQMWDQEQDTDSPGEMQFAVLNAALTQVEQ